MSKIEVGGQDQFKVVINHEEQYSLVPVGYQMPPGWREVGKNGTKEQCIKYIEEVWTDMRPANVRLQLEAELKKRGIG